MRHADGHDGRPREHLFADEQIVPDGAHGVEIAPRASNDGGGESFVESDARESLGAGLRFGVRGGLDPEQRAALRERKDDIVALARVFVSRLAPDGTATPELGADAVAALKAHGWPGNVRELRNVIERAMAYAPIPAVLRAEHLRIAAPS